jgi:hypothetical protein
MPVRCQERNERRFGPMGGELVQSHEQDALELIRNVMG